MAGHWFYDKSPAAQKAYCAAHPNSIYAKSAKKVKVPKQMKVPRGHVIKEDSAEWNAHQDNDYERTIAILTKRSDKAKQELEAATKPFSKKRLQKKIFDLRNSIDQTKWRQKQDSARRKRIAKQKA